MFFFILSSTDIDFLNQKLHWRTYTTLEALSTTEHIELVGKKEFAAIILDLEYKTFVIHLKSFSSTLLDIYLFRRSQIAKKALTKILVKYANFVGKFFPNLAFKLPKYIGINNHTIQLVDVQQSSYKPIYSLELVKVKILKVYIETNLANRFIRSFNLLASTLIFFDQKSNGFF